MRPRTSPTTSSCPRCGGASPSTATAFSASRPAPCDATEPSSRARRRAGGRGIPGAASSNLPSRKRRSRASSRRARSRHSPRAAVDAPSAHSGSREARAPHRARPIGPGSAKAVPGAKGAGTACAAGSGGASRRRIGETLGAEASGPGADARRARGHLGPPPRAGPGAPRPGRARRDRCSAHRSAVCGNEGREAARTTHRADQRGTAC